MTVELRSEVNFSSWLTIVEYLNPVFLRTMFGEETEGNLGFSNWDITAVVCVEDLDVHLVRNSRNLEYCVLQVPLRVLTSVFLNIRSPFLVMKFNVNERICSVTNISKMGALKMNVDTSVTMFWDYDYDWHIIFEIF